MSKVMYSTIKDLIIAPDGFYYVVIPIGRINDYCTKLSIDDIINKDFGESIYNKNSNVKAVYCKGSIYVEGKLRDLKNWDDGAWWDRIENDLKVTSIRQEDDKFYVNLSV